MWKSIVLCVSLFGGAALGLALGARFVEPAALPAAAAIGLCVIGVVLILAAPSVEQEKNDLLRRAGLLWHSIAWLGSGATALSAVIFADVWKTAPFMTIILLAGLQNIPHDLYEAAAIDGARSWKTFRSITLPLLMPSIMLALLFRAIQSFGIFDLIFVMTGGGPGGATETLAIYAYNTYLRYLDFGYGSAIIVASFAIMAACAAVVYWLLARTGATQTDLQ